MVLLHLVLPALAAPVDVPTSAWDLPDEVYVLPVFVLPNDQHAYVEHPNLPGTQYSGWSAMDPGDLADWHRAVDNLGAHLQIARRMFHRMLQNPLDGTSRGTFGLASWDVTTGRAEPVVSYQDPVSPLIVPVPYTAAEVSAQLAVEDLSILSETMDDLGCLAASCPFVFALVVVHDQGMATGGYKSNLGFASGGGHARFDWDQVLDANLGGEGCQALPKLTQAGFDNWVPNGCSHFQSTLVHEVGHTFGLNHVEDYGGTGTDYDQDQSDSVMSYNLDNWIAGCGGGNEAPDGDTACRYPATDDVIDDNESGGWPGALLPDDIRVLDRNRLAFADVGYARALDTSTGDEPVLHEVYAGYADIPGQSRLTLADSAGWDFNAWVGGHTEAILQAWEPVDYRRIARMGPGTSTEITLQLPDTVVLTRVRLYAGHGGAEHVQGVFEEVPRSVEVSCSDCGSRGPSVLGSTTFDDDLNRTIALAPHTATDAYTLWVDHDGDFATFRGLRMWGLLGGVGPEVEIYAAGEPAASTDFATWGGELAGTVGSAQTVPAFSDPWTPDHAWHSDAVTCDDWVSVTVAFPDDVELGLVKVHTGHAGTYHVPDLIQVERECTCRAVNSGVGGICDATWSDANCAAAGGPGNQVFEYVTREANDADHLMSFATTSTHRVKIAMHTPSGRGDCYVSVRGLRFFSPQGWELFPAAERPTGE